MNPYHLFKLLQRTFFKSSGNFFIDGIGTGIPVTVFLEILLYPRTEPPTRTELPICRKPQQKKEHGGNGNRV